MKKKLVLVCFVVSTFSANAQSYPYIGEFVGKETLSCLADLGEYDQDNPYQSSRHFTPYKIECLGSITIVDAKLMTSHNEYLLVGLTFGNGECLFEDYCAIQNSKRAQIMLDYTLLNLNLTRKDLPTINTPSSKTYLLEREGKSYVVYTYTQQTDELLENHLCIELLRDL
ncbi:hypothetical protein AGMMS49982_08970 [Bacteroidia bacterium]|nr:hypothetical protein AGMMS49982_08970 [Bacteroidia bacterium]